MTQRRLFSNQCQVEDDTGKLCLKEMTDEEIEQDGMCERCACLMSDWVCHGSPIIFGDEK